MRYCPSPSCPYAVRFKRPAEFRDDLQTCSECGSALGAAPVAAVATRAPLPQSDATSRLLISLGAFALTLLALQVPLMGEGHGLMGSSRPRSDEAGALKVLLFGLTPFFAGFLLVEVAAWLVPSWNARRVGSFRARLPLVWASLGVGVLILLLRIWNVVRFFSEDTRWNSPFSDARPEVAAPTLLWTQYLVAHLALVALAFAVSRWGLGNGFAVLTAALSAGTLVDFLMRVAELMRMEVVAAGPMLLTAAALGAVAVATVWLSHGSRSSRAERPAAAPFPVSGLGLFAAGSAMVSLPMTLGIRSLTNTLTSSSVLYTGLATFFGVDLALLLGFLFFRPAAVGKLWKRWHPSLDEASVVARARVLLPSALAWAVGASVLVPLLFSIWGRLLNLPAAFHPPVLELMVLTLVLVDLKDEHDARRRLGHLVAVHPVQRMAEVEPVLRVLEAAGIEAHAQSAAYRATQQFFAPQTPVVIWVPREKAAQAQVLLAVE